MLTVIYMWILFMVWFKRPVIFASVAKHSAMELPKLFKRFRYAWNGDQTSNSKTQKDAQPQILRIVYKELENKVIYIIAFHFSTLILFFKAFYLLQLLTYLADEDDTVWLMTKWTRIVIEFGIIMDQIGLRCYLAEILPIQRKTQSNHSINGVNKTNEFAYYIYIKLICICLQSPSSLHKKWL